MVIQIEIDDDMFKNLGEDITVNVHSNLDGSLTAYSAECEPYSAYLDVKRLEDKNA